MSTDDGEIRQQLENLGAALGDTRLPGPDAARRRARQRSRRQAGGAVLGAVAAVAVGAIAIGGLPTLNAAPPDPAKSPTGDSRPPSGDALLLTVEELEENSGADEPVGWTLSDFPEEPSIHCAPTADDADADALWRSFATPDEGRLDQFIELGTEGRAQNRFNDITVEVVDCVEERNADNPDDNWMNVIWTVEGIGDETWQADYAIQPRVGEQLTIVTVTAIRTGGAVTVLTQAGLGFHGHQVGPLPHDLAAAAATRLCGIGGGSCVTDPRPQQVFSEAAAEVPGWLTVEDIAAQAPVLAGISSTAFPEDAHGVYVCSEYPVDARAAGASSFQDRWYFDLLDDPDLNLTQVVSRFGAAAEAEAHYADLVGWAADCGAEQVGQVNGTGYEGLIWRSTDEFTTFYLGAVVDGAAVSIIVIPEASARTDDLPADQLQALVARAGERLAELD